MNVESETTSTKFSSLGQVGALFTTKLSTYITASIPAGMKITTAIPLSAKGACMVLYVRVCHSLFFCISTFSHNGTACDISVGSGVRNIEYLVPCAPYTLNPISILLAACAICGDIIYASFDEVDAMRTAERPIFIASWTEIPDDEPNQQSGNVVQPSNEWEYGNIWLAHNVENFVVIRSDKPCPKSLQLETILNS